MNPSHPPSIQAAATVLLVRDTPPESHGIEVFMLKRHSEMAFGDSYVFPGGVVDKADYHHTLHYSETDRDVSKILNLEEGMGGLAYYLAAIRECFEESGFLLADPCPDPKSHQDKFDRLIEQRLALNEGRKSFVEILIEENLKPGFRNLHYLSHWITPEQNPRRFDTRFFVARAPGAQFGSHSQSEASRSLWITPEEALENYHSDKFKLIFPTLKTLELLTQYSRVEPLFEWLEEKNNGVN